MDDGSAAHNQPCPQDCCRARQYRQGSGGCSDQDQQQAEPDKQLGQRHQGRLRMLDQRIPLDQEIQERDHAEKHSGDVARKDRRLGTEIERVAGRGRHVAHIQVPPRPAFFRPVGSYLDRVDQRMFQVRIDVDGNAHLLTKEGRALERVFLHAPCGHRYAGRINSGLGPRDMRPNTLIAKYGFNGAGKIVAHSLGVRPRRCGGRRK